MPHARQQIRDAVAAALTGLSTTGDRVYAGRTRPLAKDHEPALLVYTSEESAEAHTQSPRRLLRTLTLFVEGRVSGADVPDDTLDDIALEVETALAGDADLGELIKDIVLVRTMTDTQAPGGAQVGEVRLQFAVLYRTTAAAPQTAIA